MDSITQATLGAAVGEAVLGRQVGNKALLWGALVGTIPDLDVVAMPFLSEPAALAWHRGVSHALLVAVAAAPAIGFCLSRLYGDGRFRGWVLLGFWCYVTHVLLDFCTVYGTQLLQPFSNLPAAFPIVFIIDPLYTLPLLVAVIAVLFLRRASKARRVVIWTGLALSTAYLGWAAGVKAHVDGVVRANLEAEGIAYERFLTTPTPLNTILWTATVDVDDAFLIGHYSLLDDDRQMRFRRVEQHAARLDSLRHTEAVRTLLWFSRGYYVVTEDAGDLVVNDIRFGRNDAWLTDSDTVSYTFPFRLVREDGRVTFHQGRPAFDPTLRERLVDRVLGRAEAFETGR